MSYSRLANIPVTITKEQENRIEHSLSYLETAIKSDSEKQEVARLLRNLPCNVLIKYCSRNPEIELFCRTDKTFLNLLKSALQAYPTVEIRSMDNKFHYSLFDFYVASLFFSDFIKNNREDKGSLKNLDHACQLGLYNAIYFRCKVNQTTIQKNPSSHRALEMILADTKHLSNLFWAAGYMKAGCLLLEIAQQFLASSNQNEIIQGQAIREEAIKNFFCASFLKENAYSNDIIANLTKDKGILSLIEGGLLKISSWDEAIAKCKELAGSSFVILEKRAGDEITTVLSQGAETSP